MKFKYLVVFFFVITLSLFLSGCSFTKSDDFSQNSSFVPSTSQSTLNSVNSTEDQKQLFRYLYQPVFDSYRKIFSSPKDLSLIPSLYNSLSATKRPIGSWVVENSVFNSDKLRYAYVDLNEDSVEELIIGVQQSDGSYSISGFYYLENDKPILLSEGYVAGHGGARNTTTIYKGGEILELSWSSGTGEGRGVLYQLNPNQKAASIVKEQDIKVPGNTSLHDIFGKSESEIINIRDFDWQQFEFSGSINGSQTEQKAPWNPSKSAKLEAFIKGWGERLGQPNYKKGITGGDVGPDNLYTFGDGPSEKMNAEYSDTGLGTAQYRIVERYSNWDKFPDVHSYYFAITNTGEAIVFHSPTTNGGVMYLKPTENTEIQAEFKRLVEEE